MKRNAERLRAQLRAARIVVANAEYLRALHRLAPLPHPENALMAATLLRVRKEVLLPTDTPPPALSERRGDSLAVAS